MCFPPFCEPAHHFLGYFSIRQGAATVLVVNCAYGLCLVVTHALLLGKEQLTSTPAPAAVPAGTAADPHWLLELIDLDVSWGHNLLGFDDYTCLAFGLFYGLVIVCLSGYMFHSVHYGGERLPTTTRWFVAFFNLELVLYGGLILAKLPTICTIQSNHLVALKMECGLLKFIYINRAATILAVGGFCCWTFSSLAYFLSFGNAAMDKPEFAEMLAQHEDNMKAAPPGLLASQQRPPVGGSLLPTSMAPAAAGGSLRPGTAQSLRPPGDVPALATAGVLPGASIRSQQPPSSMRGAALPSMRGGAMPLGSLAPGRGSIPRAQSSMSTTTGGGTNAETHPFIRPPVAVF